MPQHYFDREREPVHPLLCRFKSIALSKNFKKIQITVQAIEFLLEFEKTNEYEIVPSTALGRPIEKTIKHAQIIKELTPTIRKKERYTFFKVALYEALMQMIHTLEQLSPIPENLNVTVYTKHRAQTSAQPLIILQLIIERDTVTLKLAQLINGVVATPGSLIFY